MQEHPMLIKGTMEIQGHIEVLEHLMISIVLFYNPSWFLEAQKVIVLYDVCFDSNVEEL